MQKIEGTQHVFICNHSPPPLTPSPSPSPSYPLPFTITLRVRSNLHQHSFRNSRKLKASTWPCPQGHHPRTNDSFSELLNLANHRGWLEKPLGMPFLVDLLLGVHGHAALSRVQLRAVRFWGE